MASSTDRPLVVKIQVNSDKVYRAFNILKSRFVRRNEDQFQVSTYTTYHSDIDKQIRFLLKEHKDADEIIKSFIKRLKFNNEGQQFAKAVVIGTESRLSVRVIAANRRKTQAGDQHKILMASMTKTVEISSSPSAILPHLFSQLFPLNLVLGFIFPWNLFTSLYGIVIDNELNDTLKQLNDEENKKCLEAMAFYLLGDKIQASLGDRVEVQFIQQ